MKKLTKQDLWNYLDWINFVDLDEIYMAVNDFFVEYAKIFNPSYGQLAYYTELANEYVLENAIAFS